MILALCLTNLVLGMSAACFIPAVSALIPALVSKQKLEKGNAAHQFSRVGAQVIGQGIGGLVYSVLGAAGSFVLNALSFLVCFENPTGHVTVRKHGKHRSCQ